MTVILQPGEGSRTSAMGNEITSKAISSDTGGALWVAEYTIAAGFGGPPPHLHDRMLEIFYVLDGTLRCQIGERVAELAPGGFVLVSPRTLHSFSNPTDRAGKFLLPCSPGGLEGYFDELPRLIAQHGYPPPPEVLRNLGERYDVRLPAPAGAPGG